MGPKVDLNMGDPMFRLGVDLLVVLVEVTTQVTTGMPMAKVP